MVCKAGRTERKSCGLYAATTDIASVTATVTAAFPDVKKKEHHGTIISNAAHLHSSAQHQQQMPLMPSSLKRAGSETAALHSSTTDRT